MVPALIVQVSVFFVRRRPGAVHVNFDTEKFRNCFYPELCPAGDVATGDDRHVDRRRGVRDCRPTLPAGTIAADH
jgi:hypothetical protein